MTPMQSRILNLAMPVPELGCWLWMGVIDAQGCGRICISGEDGVVSSEYAHRESYKAFKGEIPEGTCLFRECSLACCVNPEHRKPAKRLGHLLGRLPGRPVQTHCHAGHPLSGGNLRLEGPQNRRRCKACEKNRRPK